MGTSIHFGATVDDAVFRAGGVLRLSIPWTRLVYEILLQRSTGARECIILLEVPEGSANVRFLRWHRYLRGTLLRQNRSGKAVAIWC